MKCICILTWFGKKTYEFNYVAPIYRGGLNYQPKMLLEEAKRPSLAISRNSIFKDSLIF